MYLAHVSIKIRLTSNFFLWLVWYDMEQVWRGFGTKNYWVELFNYVSESHGYEKFYSSNQIFFFRTFIRIEYRRISVRILSSEFHVN